MNQITKMSSSIILMGILVVSFQNCSGSGANSTSDQLESLALENENAQLTEAEALAILNDESNEVTSSGLYMRSGFVRAPDYNNQEKIFYISQYGQFCQWDDRNTGSRRATSTEKRHIVNGYWNSSSRFWRQNCGSNWAKIIRMSRGRI